MAPLLSADDDGSGLARAYAVIDGGQATFFTLDPACADGVIPVAGCVPRVSRVPLRLDLSRLSVGAHRLQIGVVDGAGNAAVVYEGDFSVVGADPVYTPTIELAVGNPRPAPPPVIGTGSSTGTAATRCSSPRLSMVLDQRPLRVQRGRPVLLADRRYRFRGRLTCVVDGRRQGANRGIAVELRAKVGRKTRRIAHIRTSSNGRLKKRLLLRSSRTLIFRYRAAGGSSQVRIAVIVIRAGAR